jgi:hypothetical protein
VFDNSGAEPRRVITKDGDVLSVFETPIPALDHAIRTAFGESVEGLEPSG